MNPKFHKPTQLETQIYKNRLYYKKTKSIDFCASVTKVLNLTSTEIHRWGNFLPLINTGAQITVTLGHSTKFKWDITCNLRGVVEHNVKHKEIWYILTIRTIVLLKFPIAILPSALKYSIMGTNTLPQW